MPEESQIRMKLDDTKAQINLVAAVVVGPAGGRKIIGLDIATVKGTQNIKILVDTVRSVLRKKEKVFMMNYRGVTADQLEAVASNVRIID